MSLKWLNLGCGELKGVGVSGVEVVCLDLDAGVCPDVVWDLEKAPLPFEDGEFDGVFASHVVEHVRNRRQLFKEVRRVLKKGGVFRIVVPHPTSRLGAGSFFHEMPGFSYIALVDLGNEPEWELVEGKVRWSFYGKPPVIGKIVDWLANLNVGLCERLWCYWVGGLWETEGVFEAV